MRVFRRAKTLAEKPLQDLSEEAGPEDGPEDEDDGSWLHMCDYCGCEEPGVDGDTLPEGWHWTRGGHFKQCPNCRGHGDQQP